MIRKILMCGNDACGEGAVRAGCRFYAGYPITPQNELTGYMARRMPEVGGVFIQAESELAAINMVLGASAAGVRAMTSTSSPGMSLKMEGISYLVGCELPVVVVNVQRAGPGLGNIGPAQGDYFQATKGGGHGDYHTIVLAPASIEEMFEFTKEAFELADKYRNPCIVLADGLLGQMMEPVSARTINADENAVRGAGAAVPGHSKPWALTGCAGREPNVVRSFYLSEDALEAHNMRLQEKFNTMSAHEVRCELYKERDSEVIVVAYGSMARVARSVVDKARSRGIKAGMLRPITLWPFPYKTLEELTAHVKRFLVVEMSAGQMVEDVRLGVNGKVPVDFYGRMGGNVPLEEEILRRLETAVAVKSV